jgi:hypothetical protein
MCRSLGRVGMKNEFLLGKVKANLIKSGKLPA